MSNLLSKLNKTKLFYLLILLTVFTVFIFLAYLNIQVKKGLGNVDLYISPLSFTPSDYPEIGEIYIPEVTGQSVVILDKDSQRVLYEKNSKFRFPPASTTKIMTALVALDYFKKDDILTVKRSNVEGSVLGLKPGEQLRFEDLLYAMMLPSANDATLVIADNYPGGEQEFVNKMNQKARELNLTNTYYADPVGLLDDKDYSSAMDLARLASFALNNQEVAKVVSTKSRVITNLSGKSYTLSNLNILLDLPGVSGVKTGFTEKAGEVLVTSQKVDPKHELIFVVMQSDDRFGDTESLMNSLTGNVTFQSIRP